MPRPAMSAEMVRAVFRSEGSMISSRKFSAAVCGLLVSVLAAAAAPKPTANSPSTAIRQETASIAGLQKPARIVIDHWGIA
ncbi:MAG TPA: hypothetical protein VII35_14995, partial [Steroidobacteraceae bacterium]